MTFLSAGAENVLQRFSAHCRPAGAGYFPIHTLKDVDTRVGKSLHSWFCRCADAAGGVPRCCIEDNIGIIGVSKWTEGHMTYLNIQAIVTKDGRLEDFYRNESAVECQYTRLELNFKTLGPLFKEPLPHIHACHDGPPRYSFAPEGDRVLIARFLEFLYLNYAYDKWLDWAREVWQTRHVSGKDGDTFEPIVQAYNASNSDVLIKRYAKDILKLRKALAVECMNVSRNLPSISPNARILSY